MKKLCVGVLSVFALLFAQTAFAEPCGLCQAYYPCDWACEHCARGPNGPGMWVDGSCWGDVIYGTCGDINQCGWQPQTSTQYDEPVVGQSINPEQGAQSLPVLMLAAPLAH